MYGDTALFLAGSHHRLVDTFPIHSLSPVFRKKRRMYIYDFIGISMQKQIRDPKQETCQHNEIDTVLLQNSQNLVTGHPILLREYVGRYF